MGFLPEHFLFVRNLMDALRVYDPDARRGLERALGAVARYLQETAAPPNLMYIFFSLRLALRQLDQGVVHDVRPKLGRWEGIKSGNNSSFSLSAPASLPEAVAVLVIQLV
jgi:hypothetical protein